MKSEKEQQLESDVVEAAVHLRRYINNQSTNIAKNNVALLEAVKAYNDYSQAVQALVYYRDGTIKSN